MLQKAIHDYVSEVKERNETKIIVRNTNLHAAGKLTVLMSYIVIVGKH